MTEDLLHYIWKFKRFELNKLQTQEGESIQIINAGTHNKDAGPDFVTAQIKIGDTLWAGNVEIHVNASDWYKHRHQNDKRTIKLANRGLLPPARSCRDGERDSK